MSYAMPDISKSPSLALAPALPDSHPLPEVADRPLQARGASDRHLTWRAVTVSVCLHVLIGALVLFGLRRTTTPDLAPQTAMAVQIMPMPAAPPAPAHETPPEPQKPAPTPKLEQQKQQLPEVPKNVDAVDPVTLPPKQQQATPPRQPSAPPPAAPTQQVAAAAAAPVQGQPTQGTPTARQNWEGLVLARLERKKRYPGEAMSAGQEDV